MLLKKIGICICLISAYFLGFGYTLQVSAAEPNAKECLEKEVDCNELKNNSTDGTTNIVGKNEDSSIVFDLVKMVFALILVLALIYLLLKFLSKRNKVFQQVRALENIGGISVGQNKSIQIIRISNRIYIVGVGENVELLHEITSEKEKDELLNLNQTNEFQAGSLISSFFKQKNNNDHSTTQTKTDFKNLFTTELDKLKDGRSKLINHHKRKGDKDE